MALSRVNCYDVLMTSHYTGVCFGIFLLFFTWARERDNAAVRFLHVAIFSSPLSMGGLIFRVIDICLHFLFILGCCCYFLLEESSACDKREFKRAYGVAI